MDKISENYIYIESYIDDLSTLPGIDLYNSMMRSGGGLYHFKYGKFILPEDLVFVILKGTELRWQLTQAQLKEKYDMVFYIFDGKAVVSDDINVR